MLRHLRLARARGSLVAPNSPVQDRALEYLLLLDEIERDRQRFEKVKALVASPFTSLEKVRDQFPEYFDPFEEAKNPDGTYDVDKIDPASVEWQTPASPDQDDEIARWIAEREQGSVSAADFD